LLEKIDNCERRSGRRRQILCQRNYAQIDINDRASHYGLFKRYVVEEKEAGGPRGAHRLEGGLCLKNPSSALCVKVMDDGARKPEREFATM